MARNAKEELREALLRYNDGVRWGKAEWMVPHVAAANRDALLRTRVEFGDLQITGCDVSSVVMEGNEQAEAIVHVSWYLARQGRLRTSVLVQRWARSGGTWQIQSQRLARGAPYPLVAVQK